MVCTKIFNDQYWFIHAYLIFILPLVTNFPRELLWVKSPKYQIWGMSCRNKQKQMVNFWDFYGILNKKRSYKSVHRKCKSVDHNGCSLILASRQHPFELRAGMDAVRNFSCNALHNIVTLSVIYNIKRINILYMSQSKIIPKYVSGGVSKILTACRMLQISIAQRQMKAKIPSFLTTYILGGFLKTF